MLLKIPDIANLILHIVFATVLPQKDEESWEDNIKSQKTILL